MSQISPRVGLPYLMPSQAQKHVIYNEALRRLDALTQLAVEGFDQLNPPTLPVDGDMYALGDTPAAEWAGQGGKLAYWEGDNWLFLVPPEGCRAWGRTEAELRIWHDGNWQVPEPDLNGVAQVGINSVADATNRLSVSAPASMLTHEGEGHQLKINKAAEEQTASVLFQSAWSGHAEIGLAGENAFSVKLSHDGQSWYEALQANPETQELRLSPAGVARAVLSDTTLVLDVPMTGTAVQTDPADTTTGLLLPVGAFGLGGEAVQITDLNDVTGSGFYRIGSMDSATGHTPDVGDWLVSHVTYDGTTAAQTAHSVDTANPRLFCRNMQTSLWGPWRQVWSQADVIGPVSQAWGMPTGALVEHGSNANGAYVRFVDGTQICWQDAAGIFTTSAFGNIHRDMTTLGAWTFPAAFSVDPFAAIQFNATGVWGTCSGVTPTQVTNRVLFSANAASAVGIGYGVFASGRWY